MNNVYDHPRYYEIAFSYRDIPAEVDTLEQCFKRYTKPPVESVLEIGSGNSPHMPELLKRGYAYTGLDLSPAMLAYSAEKAAGLDGKAAFIHADMVDFSISETFDFAYITLGSLNVKNTLELLSHLRSVAGALKIGGIYLMDWCVQFSPLANQDESWTMEQENIKVTTHWEQHFIDAPEQLVEESFSLDVIDQGKVHHLTERGVHRMIFPQEFLQMVEQTERFEFVGWWDNWNLERPLGEVKDPKKISRPILLLRRK